MSAHDFQSLLDHAGHAIEVVTYTEGEFIHNVAVECQDCGEVLLDYENPQKLDQSEDGDISKLLAIANIAFEHDDLRKDMALVLNMSNKEVIRLRRKVKEALEAIDAKG